LEKAQHRLAETATDQNAVVPSFVEWRNSPDNFRSPGISTMAAVGNLEEGTPWREAGSRNSKGCGSVMRTAPIGFYYQDEPERMREASHAVGAATHANPAADAACLAATVSAALAFREVPLAEWLPRVCEATRGVSAEFDETVARLGKAAALPDEGEAQRLAAAKYGGWTADEVWATALLGVLRHPDDFEACVLSVVNTGGDSDSIGCVAGALQGARLGAAAIPERWRAGVERSADLLELADRLHAARASNNAT
ncbi:MAG: ADP-ribosylglycohydrolase family protein, partial [Elusimicrobia bacterium]|nr:ADP-ribosylglycohydrolase family protein [Elusimicrobiota bacterium]